MAESFVHPETAIASLSSLLDVARCLFVRPQDVRVAFVARTPWLEKGDIVHGNLDADQLRQVIQHLYPEVLSDAEKLRAERDQLRADVERCAQVGWYGLVEAERKNASRHYGAALALAENRDRAVRRAEAAEARVAELKAEVEQLKNERHELRGEVHVLTEQLLGAKSEVAHLEQELEVCQDGEREREQELEREVERLRDLLRRVRDPFAANGEVAAGEGIGAVYEALLAEIDALGPQAPPAPKGVHP